MKVAIIGCGPKALNTALYFDQLGAALTLFYTAKDRFYEDETFNNF